MNLKKFISGVSALTIAASAFAGMAVTANAAVGDPAITGTYADGKFSWSFDGLAAPANSGTLKKTYSGTAVNPDNDADNVKFTFVTGQYRNSSANYYDNILDGGICFARSTATVAGNINYRYIAIAPSKTGTLTFDAAGTRVYGSRNDYTSKICINDITGVASAPYAITEDNVLFSGVTNGGSFSTSDLSYVMTGGHTYIITVIGADQNNLVTFSDFTYEDAPAELAAGLTVNFVTAGETKVGDMDVDTTGAFAEASFTYYVPAYVEGTDGKLYATSKGYERTATLATTDVTKNETVSLYTEDTHQFVDFNDTEITSNGKDILPTNFSGGAARTGNSNEAVNVLTVAEDGIYKVIVHGGDKSTDNPRTGELAVNGTKIGDVTYTNYGGTDNTFNDVPLKAGDALTVSIGRGSSSALDYVLIVKTADLPVHTAATYDTALTQVYNGTTGDNVWAKAYTFTVTPNDDTVTAVKVTDSTNSEKFVEKTGLNLTGTGAIVFGILAAAQTEADLDGISFIPSITTAE